MTGKGAAQSGPIGMRANKLPLFGTRTVYHRKVMEFSQPLLTDIVI
jgi:hypothetical protein